VPYSDIYSDIYEGDFLFVVDTTLPSQDAWHVVNSVTGNLIGRLPQPNSYTLTEPVKEGTTSGELRIPLPSDRDAAAELRAWLRPDPLRSFSRSIVWEDGETGKLLFGGPIPWYPQRDGAEIVVPLVDWRAWFYHTVMRPNGSKFDSKRSSYKSTSQDQADVMNDLASAAIESYAPYLSVDNSPDTNVTRKITIKMFQGESIGKWLDDLASRDKGAEWGTYMTRTSDTRFLPHFKVYWPEKRSTKVPIELRYEEGEGGNVAGYNWPGGIPAATRLFATDGAEDTKLWGVASLPGIKSGTELVWEELVQLADGTKKKADATTRAKGELAKATGREGEFTMTVTTEFLKFTDYVVGDRFHVVLEDNWDALDAPAARCVQRVLSGGAGQPDQQVLTLDISDVKYRSDGTLPGYAVS
jgi:hypothetical protein